MAGKLWSLRSLFFSLVMAAGLHVLHLYHIYLSIQARTSTHEYVWPRETSAVKDSNCKYSLHPAHFDLFVLARNF